MNISRRKLLAAGVAVAGVAAIPSVSISAAASAAEPKTKPKAALKLSCQVWMIPGRDLPEKLALMEKWGFDAVELPGDIVGNEKKYIDAGEEDETEGQRDLRRNAQR